MTIQRTHSLETVGGVSLAVGELAADGAGVTRTPESAGGLGLDLLDALTLLAKDKVRSGGLRLVCEDGLLPAITQHLMQAALEAELEEHLAAEAERIGGRGSRSGGNGRNGYRTKKVMSEVGPITLQIPRERLGTFRPRVLPKEEPVAVPGLAGRRDGLQVLGQHDHGAPGTGRRWRRGSRACRVLTGRLRWTCSCGVASLPAPVPGEEKRCSSSGGGRGVTTRPR